MSQQAEVLDSDYFKERALLDSDDAIYPIADAPEPEPAEETEAHHAGDTLKIRLIGTNSAPNVYDSIGSIDGEIIEENLPIYIEESKGQNFRQLLAGITMVLAVILTRTAEPIAVAYSKGEQGFAYNVSVVVILVEVTKFCFSGVALSLHLFLVKDPVERKKLVSFSWIENVHYILPSVLYAVANTLLFGILALINPGIYHVLANMKILTTGLMFRYFLGKALDDLQWVSLMLLTLGTVMSMPEVRQLQSFWQSSVFYGFLLCLIQQLVSSAASVYIERHFKKTRSQSIHFQNMQLYIYGIFVNALYLIKDYSDISSRGMFHGWTYLVVITLLVEASVGIALSFVFKFMDNIVYVFAMAGAMFTTAIISIWLFDFSTDVLFYIALLIVSVSVYLYYHNALMFNRWRKAADEAKQK